MYIYPQLIHISLSTHKHMCMYMCVYTHITLSTILYLSTITNYLEFQALCLVLRMEKQPKFDACLQIANITLKLFTCLVYLTHMPSISLADRTTSSFHISKTFVNHLFQVIHQGLTLNFQSA